MAEGSTKVPYTSNANVIFISFDFYSQYARGAFVLITFHHLVSLHLTLYPASTAAIAKLVHSRLGRPGLASAIVPHRPQLPHFKQARRKKTFRCEPPFCHWPGSIPSPCAPRECLRIERLEPAWFYKRPRPLYLRWLVKECPRLETQEHRKQSWQKKVK
jgi:hypothetical protein